MKKSLDKEWKANLSEQQENDLLRHALQQKFDAELRQRWWKKLASDSTANVISRKAISGQRKVWWALAASLLLLISAALWLFSEPKMQKEDILAHKFLEEVASQATDTYMGPNQDSNTWQSAQEHFVKRQFDDAIREVESLANSKPLTAKHLYFLSLCYLQKDPPAYNLALAKLQSAREVNRGEKTPLFVEEIEWVEVLALVLKEDRSAAKAQLQRIAQADGWFSEKAKTLLSTLD